MGAVRLQLRPRPALRSRTHRRGVAALMAMLYLMLFSVMALGFFASTTTSQQVVQNDLAAMQAQFAAESGLGFVRMHLKEIKVPAFTSDEALLAAVRAQLAAQLEATPNLGAHRVGHTAQEVSFPYGDNGVIDLGDGGFRVDVHLVAGRLAVDVTGVSRDGSIRRTLRCGFDRHERNSIFNYAVVSRGTILTGSSSVVTATPDSRAANLLSTSRTEPKPVVLSGSVVGGEVFITQTDAEIVHNGGSVYGQTDKAEIQKHLIRGALEPEFPVLNPALFRKYVTQEYSIAGSLLNGVLGTSHKFTNCRVRTGTNAKFGANDVIEGVLWIEPGNTVEFAGGCTIRGTIVVEHDTRFTPEQTRLIFRGHVNAYGMETLDPVKFGDLVQQTGTFILADNAVVDFGGNLSTTDVGSIFASRVTVGGSAGGSVIGSIVSLDPRYPLTIASSQSNPLVFKGRALKTPAGAGFSSYFTIKPQTYEELAAGDE